VGTRAVIDANVLMRALADSANPAREWVNKIVDGSVRGLAPDLVFSEFANSITLLVRYKKLPAVTAVEILATAVDLPLRTSPARALSGAAFGVAMRTGLTAYDAHYLALAEAEEAVLVTADRRLAEAASNGILLT
jgi:predicted nucleic acid-binding protein